ncbi:MAG: TlpA family protein disulfide reductase [Candidatus Deferrimicrobiaceae bacterium]
MRRGIRKALPVAAGVLLLACGLTLAHGKEQAPDRPPESAPEKIPSLGTGAAAPGFRLTDVLGAKYSYGEEGGRKPLLLIFFSFFCDPCRANLPVLQKIQDKYGGGVDVAAVSLDGEPLKAMVAGFAKQEGYTFRVLLDEGDEKRMFKVADAYRVTEIPTLFLVDRGGKVTFAGMGRVAEETLEKAVQAVLKK